MSVRLPLHASNSRFPSKNPPHILNPQSHLRTRVKESIIESLIIVLTKVVDGLLERGQYYYFRKRRDSIIRIYTSCDFITPLVIHLVIL